jgi:hypothetical protein
LQRRPWSQIDRDDLNGDDGRRVGQNRSPSLGPHGRTRMIVHRSSSSIATSSGTARVGRTCATVSPIMTAGRCICGVTRSSWRRTSVRVATSRAWRRPPNVRPRPRWTSTELHRTVRRTSTAYGWVPRIEHPQRVRRPDPDVELIVRDWVGIPRKRVRARQ